MFLNISCKVYILAYLSAQNLNVAVIHLLFAYLENLPGLCRGKSATFTSGHKWALWNMFIKHKHLKYGVNYKAS